MSDIPMWPDPVDRAVLQAGRSRAVRLRRRYDTSVDDVWDAWTSPDRLRRWLGEVTGDATQGATVILDMGAEESATCKIVRCEPPRRLVVTWSDAEVTESAVQLNLRPDGDATLLELEHLGFPDSPLSRIFGEGWEDFLDRLGQHIAGTEVQTPSWDEVRTALDPHWNPLADDPTPDDRWPTVTDDGDRAILNAHRTYPGPAHRLWTAITDPKHLGAWFADVELGDGGAVGDPAGTSWRAVFTYGAASGVIQSCIPEHEIVTTWRWDHQDSGSVLHVTLEPAGDGTLVRIEQRDTPSDGAGGYGAGWYAMLGGLAIHLDGRVPTEADWEADFALARRTVQPFRRDV